MNFLESITGLLRPLPVRGKGRIFNSLTPWTGTKRVRIFDGIEMDLNLANGQQRQIYMGCFNLPLQKAMKRLLGPGKRFLDVGANVGFFTMLGASLVGSTGKVVAVEPFPANIESLQKNIQDNHLDNVQMLPIALSGETGILRLFAPPPESHREYNVSIVASDSNIAIDVPARPLDDCFKDWGHQPFDFMKIDVEGAEANVFAGGSDSLCRGLVRHLICELNAHCLRKLGSSQAELYAKITALGFLRAEINGHRAVPLKGPTVLSETGDPDMLFIHRTAISS